MGRKNAEEMAESVSEGLTNLYVALIYHFRHNHYPPLPVSLIPIAISIINGSVSEEDVVLLPAGISWKGQTSAPVSECIQAWHLDSFMLNPDDYEQEE